MLLIMYFSEYQFLKGVHKNVSTSLKTLTIWDNIPLQAVETQRQQTRQEKLLGRCPSLMVLLLFVHHKKIC